MHVVIPHPGGDEYPRFIAATSRHVNGRVVATGPMFATAFVDAPYPQPGIRVEDYVTAVITALLACAAAGGLALVHGTRGATMRENLLPHEPPIVDPLW